MQTNTTSALRTIVRNWWGTPAPSFQLRKASEHWGRFGSGKKRRTLRIVEVVQETPTTSTFVLEPLDREPIEYLPGQHLTLLIEIDGVAHRRCYSFSSSPGASEWPAITVKNVPGGRVSGFLTQNLGKAQTIRAAEPAGSFTVAVDPAASRHWFEGRLARSDWNQIIQAAPFMQKFRLTMFKRLIPNLEYIGLLTPRVQHLYEQAGLMTFAGGKSAAELSAQDLLDELG